MEPSWRVRGREGGVGGVGGGGDGGAESGWAARLRVVKMRQVEKCLKTRNCYIFMKESKLLVLVTATSVTNTLPNK